MSAHALAAHARAFAFAAPRADDTPRTDDAPRAVRQPARDLPATPRRVRIGMPHLDPGGLSENWLFRYAGDLHWEAIGARMGAASDEIRSDLGQRLYPTFVAVRARYDAPLAQVRENDVLEATAEVAPCGRACAQGRVVASVGQQRLELELLTTFALREAPGVLKMALPAARLARSWTPLGDPAIARLAKAARRGEPLGDEFAGPSLLPGRPPLGSSSYEPSPYADFNGAGLLYFASYVTIADTAERRLVRELGLARFCGRAPSSTDWALCASTVRRDVYYYGNLPLGEAVTVDLIAFEPEPAAGVVKTRMRLRRQRTGEVMADIVTRRALRPDEARAGGMRL